MRSPSIHARRLGAVLASVALAATVVGTATAAPPVLVAPCVRSAPSITFGVNPLVMPVSGAPAYVRVRIRDEDSESCSAYQVFQWKLTKVGGATAISALIVSNWAAALRPGMSFDALIRVWGFASPSATAGFSFQVTRMAVPGLTPARGLLAVRVTP